MTAKRDKILIYFAILGGFIIFLLIAHEKMNAIYCQKGDYYNKQESDSRYIKMAETCK